MKTFAAIFLCSMLLLLAASSQEKKPQREAVPGYDTANQETFTGSVLEIKEYKCPVTGTVGSHLALKGANEVIEVHLAPVAFMKEYGIVFKTGDKLDVVGTRVTFAGKPALLARSAKVGRETFLFRDEKGRPLW